ncbi:uncharacterized protein LOC110452834 isoform X2 [Mizuhopecten yessoensis]|uniref:uncharacterized protein LOC110452834 isoform X2 n=1 Tax=Mizuhopecten yessoensis TaxID=6573 RepID=UPI000B45B5BE|nr:uncharacterized protein LOC110452834 isoform X2 [Mizuhopecten yessoensis]
MAVASAAETLTWSQNVCTLGEAIVSHTLPVLVRVEERSCGHQDTTLSHGDILKLDTIHWIPSVQACSLTRKLESSSWEFIHNKDTFSIPLGYKGLLRLTNPNARMTVFGSVKEVLKARPRYVRTIEPVIQNGQVVIGKKCDLEITICAEQVVCTYADNTYVLDEDTETKLLHLPDDSLYTLQEVCDRYPYPQCVSFIKNDYTEWLPAEIGTNFIREVGADQELIEGTFQLSGAIQQDLVVGCCKAVCEAPCGSGIAPNDQNVIIIRPDSSTVKHVHVVVCQAENSRAYQSFIGSHFQWETGLDQSILDEAIIMDFLILKDSRPTVNNTRHPTELTGQSQTAGLTDTQTPTLENMHQDASYMEIGLYENDDHLYTVPETRGEAGGLELPNCYHRDDGFVQKAKALFSKLNLKDKVQKLKSKVVTAVQPETSNIHVNDITDDDYIIPERPLPKPPTQTPLKPPTKPTLNQKVKKIPKDSHKFLSKPKLFVNQENPYTVQKLEPNTARVFKKEIQRDVMSDVSDGDGADYVNVENVLQKHTEIQKPKDGPKDLNNEEPSVSQENASVMRSTNEIDPPDKVFASLSVTGLANRLVTCGLKSVAEFCLQEKVDGRLFTTFTDDDLRAVFSMSQLQIKKIRMAQNLGWTPKV